MTTIAPTRRRRRRSLRHRVNGGLLSLLAWVAGIAFFFPVGWMVLSSFKAEGDAYTNPPKFIFEPTFEQYITVFERGIEPYVVNSLFASLVSLAIVLVLAVPAAYALSVRRIGRWRDSMFFFLSTRFLPPAAAIVPLYLIARDIGALDNIWTLTILYSAMNLSLAIWMLQSFMSEIPTELFEAASLDGASLLTTFRRIILPLMLPGIAATAVICFIFSWNEFFFAVNLTSSSAETLPIFLVGFMASEGPFWAQLSAAATLATLPVLLVGWMAQDKLVRGLTMGAVK